MGIKLVYSDISVGAKENFVPSTTDKQSFVDLGQLQQEGLSFPHYISPCELYQTVLDNSQMTFLPTNLNESITGLLSLSQSKRNKQFNTPITLTLTATANYSSQGITLVFDPDANQYCADLNIKWYRNSTLLSSKDFFPDSVTYFCRNQVSAYNKVVITFKSMNLPFVYLKLRAINWGTVRILLGDELSATKIVQEVNPISEQISINTFDFVLRSKSDVDYVFQKKQPIEIYFNNELKGVHFVDTSKRTQVDTWSVQTVDYIGLLEKARFLGGIYTNKNAHDLVTEILSEAKVPFEMQTVLKSKTVTGHLPISHCREALMQVAFAIGANIDTSNSNKVNITTLNTTSKHTFTLDEVYQGQSFEQSDKLTQFNLTAHTYMATTEAIEAYKASESGSGNNILVEFSEPLHSLTITNGTILQSGANYAIINATNTNCVLSGKKYNHSTKVISIKNPLTEAADLLNVVSIEKATLISNNNVPTIAQKCYDYFVRSLSVNAKLLMTNVKAGDTVTIDSDFLEPTMGVIEKMSYNMNGGIIAADVVVK